MDEDEETRPSSFCKNECLKCLNFLLVQCQCFFCEWFCSDDCKCEGCWNRVDRRILVEEHAELRLNTKPGACQGCTCKKSGCKKDYCEFFKNQVACTVSCKCQGCENSQGTGRRGLQKNSQGTGRRELRMDHLKSLNITSDGGDGSFGGF
ncbi:hypothetical protein BDA96_03G236600 [Sorghum bicolor]|uniref:CRC domain-containing protein n=1 Tax=Sorghum bicolor TaxID=4558 RepID=A0A921REV4_SORBI|nr:hypothetical protein BDA96_03G236600 [Sorghum bicolor]